MKTRFVLFSTVIAALVATGTLPAREIGEDVKCPVSGKPVNPKATLEHNGGTVYFCCNNCPKAFKADTAKYAAKANHQMVQTGELKQVACPLTGKPVNPATEIEIDGAKVAFCCNGCKGKVNKASDEEKLNLVFSDDAAAKGFKAAK